MAANTKMMKRVKGIGHNTLLFATIMGVAMFSQSADASVVSEVIESSDNDNHKIYTDIKPVSIMEESIVASTQNSKENVLSLDADEDTTVVSTLQATQGVLTANHVSGKVASSSVQSSSHSSTVQTTTVQTSLRSGHVTGAAAPTPVLTTLNSQVSSYVAAPTSHALTKLDSGDVPAGAVSLIINGETYYYTPGAAEDKNFLISMAGYGTGAIKTTTNSSEAIYSYNDGENTTYYTYDTAKLPESVYSYSGGTDANYNVAYTDGTTTEYKLVNLDTGKMKTATNTGSLTWTKISKDDTSFPDETTFPATSTFNYVESGTDLTSVDGKVRFKLPGVGENVEQYYKFNFTPSGSKNARIESLSSDVNGGYFYGNIGTADGAAIYNGNSLPNVNISADFINNGTSFSKTTEAYGAAIYNNGSLNNINGNFIGNSLRNMNTSMFGAASFGGGIYNSAAGTINSVVANSIGNSVEGSKVSGGCGGFISNYGLIDSISAYAIGNKAQGGSSSTSDSISGAGQGGVIYNTGIINSITGNIIGNTAVGGYNYSSNGSYSAGGSGSGGAIYNNGVNSKIVSIAGDFIANSAIGGGANKFAGGKAFGGAIYNFGSINNIAGDFIGNFAQGANGGSNGAAGNAYGGAIYNERSIDRIVANFIGNRAVTGTRGSYSSEIPTGVGGAIANSKTISLIEGDFINNYAEDKTSSNRAFGGAIYNGGYNVSFSDSANMTLGGNTFTGNYVNNNEVITPNSIYNAGIINVADSATVTVNDGYNGLNEAQLNIGTGSIFNLSVDNDYIQTDNLGTVTNNGTFNWDLDVDFSNATQKSDLITVNDSSTLGLNSVLIRSINLMTDPTSEYTVNVAAADSVLANAVYIAGGSLDVHGVDDWKVTYNNGVLTFAPDRFVSGGGTIDDIKEESQGYLALDSAEHGKYTELSTTKDASHPDVVVINGTTYYFKADESAYDPDNTTVVRNLAATGSSALKEVESTDNWIFNVGGKYYTYNKKALPQSVYEVADGTIEDYTFYTFADDNVTKEYHNVVLRTDDMKTATGTGELTWTKISKDDTSFPDETTFPATSTFTYVESAGDLTSVNGKVRFKLPGVGDNVEQYYKFDFNTSGDDIGDFVNTDIDGGYMYGTSGGYIGADDLTIKADVIGGVGKNAGGGMNVSNNNITLIGNYIGNSAPSTSSNGGKGGGVYVYNTGLISGITGNFIGNTAVEGGAIYNHGTISSITGNFIGNYANSDESAYGGAINNNGIISSITGDFIGNSAATNGGAISQGIGAHIGSITGDFIGNSATGIGGAIYNGGTVSSITGDFIGNSSNALGGAIYSKGAIETLKSDFIGNTANGGGAIYLDESATITSIEGDFVNNSANANGGAIYNGSSTASIGSINGNFINNVAYAPGGAINNAGGIASISGNFINNSSGSNAGAINNSNNILSITGNFENNRALGGNGGAIANNSTGKIGSIEGNFTGNTSTVTGGAIENLGFIRSITGDFTGNTAGNAPGGAIYNEDFIATLTGNFRNNSTSYSSGGAIHNLGAINLVADDRNIEFYNNTANGSYKDIYGGNVGLSAGTDKSISFGGTLDSVASLSINPTSSSYHDAITNTDEEITRPKGGKYIFNNAVNVNGAMNLYNNADVKLGSILQADNTTTTYGSLNVGSLVNDVNGGSIDSQNGHIENNTIGAITLGSNLNMAIDAALNGTAQVDNIALNGAFNDNNHKLNINGINILSDSAYKHSRAQFLTSAGNYAKVSGSGNATKASTVTGNYTYAYNTTDGKIYFNNTDIKNLLTAVRDNDAEIIGTYPTYTLSANEDVHADASNFSAYETITELGTIAGDSLAIDGSTAKYGINGSHTEGDVTTNYGGITVGASKTLQLFRLGSVDSTTGDIIASVNGFESVNGGFVNNSGDLEIQNSVFYNNRATANGGAVYNNGTFITSDSGAIFDSNNAEGNGGAVYNNATINSLTGTFSKNSADANGGAVYNSSTGTITSLLTSNFNLNSALNGGAIYNDKQIDNLGASFSGNSATANGGAIFNSGLISSITGDFTNNSADGYGGAIYNTGAIVDVKGNFTGNSDAAIYNSGEYATVAITADSSDVTFNNNKIGDNYVDITNDGGNIMLNAKTDYAITFNGAINGATGTIELNKNSFLYYDPTTTPHSKTATARKTGGTYKFNNTVQGALNLNNGASVVLGSATQSDSSVSHGTLALSSLKTASAASTIDTQNGHIDAHSLGNVNLGIGSNLNVAIDAAINGTPQGDSFAIDSFTSGTSKLNINSVLLSSGSNYRHSDVQLITTTAGTPTDVYARVSGSGVATNGAGVTGTYNYVYNATNGKLHFNNTAINNLMTAVRDGDVSTYILTGNENVRQDALSYSADTPTSLGTMFGSSLLIDGTSDNHYGIDASYIEGGLIKGHGGIDINSSNKTLTVQHLGSAAFTKDANNNYIYDENGRVAASSIDTGNSVNGFTDSFIKASGSNAVVLVDDVVFANNSADKLINITGTGTKKITNSKFIGNGTAGSNYGLIQTNNSISEISHSAFVNNDVPAIYTESSISNPIASIDHVDFVGNKNTSTVSGGAGISASGGYISTLENSLFESNNALYGGAVSLSSSSTIDNASNIKFLGNTSTYNDSSNYGGGALSLSASKINNMENSLFSGNMANRGGAVNSTATSIATFKDTNFNNNAAKLQGGAIFNRSSSIVNIIADTANVEFANNYVGTNAATVRNADGTYLVTGDNLTANDIHNEANLNLKAKADRSITFNGTITDAETPTGITTIGGTDYAGTVNFNDKVTQKSIVVKTGTVNAKAEDLAATDGIKNDATIVFNNTANGTIGSAITGDIGTGNIKIDAADGVTVKADKAITNQIVSVDSGILHLASSSSLGGASAVTVKNGAGINTIDNAINNYMTGTNVVTLKDGSRVYVDIDGQSIDTFAADSNATVTLANVNIKGAEDLHDGQLIQLISSGAKATVEGTTLFVQQDGKTVAIQGSGQADGKVKVGESTSSKLNGAVDVSGAVGALTYSMSANEVVNDGGQAALGEIKNSFIITSDNPTTSTTPGTNRTVHATNGTYGLIVKNGHSLTTNDITFENFATNDTYKGVITVESGATLNVNNTTFKKTTNGDNIVIHNHGTLVSDPSHYEGGVMVYDGATATFSTGDTFKNIDRSAYDGGAIINETTGQVTTNGVIFNNNKARNGGSIYTQGTTLSTGDTFTKNVAVQNGGAIYNSGVLTVSGASFGDGTDTNGNIAQGGKGGAIYNTGTLNIIDSSFKKNGAGVDGSVQGKGGAIYSEGNVNITSTDAQVLFQDNDVTDGSGTGTDEGNKELSTKRANVVKDILVNEYGFDASKISTSTAFDTNENPTVSRCAILNFVVK